ncbi:hypothetical protein CBL_11758 [Carabus blaptoides fortunei]
MEIQITMNERQRQGDSEKIANDIKIYASLLPDEIIYNGGTSRTQAYYGAVLFADVSGFTDLCEKYNQMGKAGLSRLTVVLNSFIGAMVEEILIREGDVLKFSGDAFLALWKRRKNVPMSEVVHSALDTALSIQESHGTFRTDIGVTLRVKIAISAGHLMFTVLDDSSFMVVGDTIWEIKDVGNACLPGDIIIAPNIMYYVTSNDYIFGQQTVEGYMKVLGTKRSIDQLLTFRDTFINPAVVESEPEHPLADSVSEENLQEHHLLGETQDDFVPFTLRPSLDYAVQHKMRDFLCNFIIAPVVKVVDQHEPLDCLTEMRLVVIVFINVIVDMDVDLERLTEIVDHTYSIICRDVSAMEGCVNKVSMFDKDLMCLVIFGLRGLNYTLKIQRALQCAARIRRNLQPVFGLQSVSVGVTSGVTYCGVVGHPLRKEYTVIGRTVNKAARLMVAYPNMITCDTYIFLYSRLQARYFNTQPSVKLKGFQNVGPIYEYNDECLQPVTQMQLGRYPLLGRQQQLDLFFTLSSGGGCKMLVIKADGRQGKSALLAEMAHQVQRSKHMCVYTCVLNDTDTQIPYKAIRCIYYDRLRLTEHDPATRTKKFAQIFSLHQVPAFLCSLNDIFHVQFPESAQFLTLDEDQKCTVRQKMLTYLCRMIFKVPSAVFIDNVHHMDARSWTLLQVFLDADRVFVCVTDDDYTALPGEAASVLRDARIHTLHLEGIHKKYHAAFICQMVQADGVDLDLERCIQVQSVSNPGIIENLVISLFHSSVLGITTTDAHTAYRAGLVCPPASMLTRDMNVSHETREDPCPKFETRQYEIWNMYAECIKNDDETDTIPDARRKMRVCVTVGEECSTGTDTYHALDDDCKDLPNYAMCGFIRFRQDNFRKIVYNMLTESQLKVYHVRAIWYLENETRRCAPCGGGYFTRLLGQIYDDGMLCESVEHLPSLTDLNMPFGLSMESIMHGDYLQEDNELLWLDADQHHKSYRQEQHTPTYTGPVQPRTFADNLLVNCQCIHILDNMYWQMVYHCRETDLYEKLLYAAVEYIPLCLSKLNTALCMELLATATDMLESKIQNVQPESWLVPLMRGRIHTLAGHVYTTGGDLQRAERCLQAALHCYNLTFPTSRVRRAIATRYKQLKQRLYIRQSGRRYIGIDERTLAEQTSDTLAALYTVYRRLGQHNRAYLASIWCLNKALKADSNFAMLCAAYTAVFTTDMHRSRSTTVIAQLEQMALRMCYRKLIRLEMHELEAVIKMYVALFTRKYLCENMAKALHIGFIVLQMNMARICANYKCLQLALLVQAYVFTGQVTQALTLLQQLACLQHVHDAKLLYLAMCLTFRLDTTILVLPLAQFKLYEVFRTRKHQKTIPSADIRYHVALWLWYVRTENWERECSLTYHMHDILTWPCVTGDPHLVHMYLQLLEGLLLVCRRCIQLVDRTTLSLHRRLARRHAQRLHRVTCRLRCARPRCSIVCVGMRYSVCIMCMCCRYLHLKAYYHMIFGKPRVAHRLLQEAQTLALACSNVYEYKWIAHNCHAWRQPASKDPWLRAAAADDWQTDDTLYYTLPLP